ncbi:hypothetical protein P8452_46008 [Trifolium repens]|nr:hypothetical protein P8452_46008 [Trifolium repens]
MKLQEVASTTVTRKPQLFHPYHHPSFLLRHPRQLFQHQAGTIPSTLPPLAGSKADICNPKNTVNRFSSIAYVLAYITSTSLGSRHVHGSSLVRVKRGNG